MKKLISVILCAALSLAVLTACGSTAAPAPTAEPVQTAEPTAEPTPEPAAEPTPEPVPEPISDPLVMYKDVLDVYAQALTDNCGGAELIEKGISLLNMYCYDGNALDNVGYTFLDLDNDGTDDVTFDQACAFVLQLSGGRPTAVEVDRAVTATVASQQLKLSPFSPVAIERK